MGQPIFTLNKEKFEQLCKFRDWRFPASDLARATGYTKAYISQVLSEKISLCVSFMLAYIKTAGFNYTKPKEWASLFCIRETNQPQRPGKYKTRSYQKDNYLKYEGKVPYREDSLIGPIRMKDREEESEQTDFYEGAIPKQLRVKHKFKKQA